LTPEHLPHPTFPPKATTFAPPTPPVYTYTTPLVATSITNTIPPPIHHIHQVSNPHTHPQMYQQTSSHQPNPSSDPNTSQNPYYPEQYHPAFNQNHQIPPPHQLTQQQLPQILHPKTSQPHSKTITPTHNHILHRDFLLHNTIKTIMRGICVHHM
jgi:hypothetical protein